MVFIAVLAGIITATFGIAAEKADSTTALEMASYCKPVAEAKRVGDKQVLVPLTHEAGLCWGYFDAIHRAVNVQFAGDATPVLLICQPAAVTITQMVLVFRRYFETHPAEAHKDAFIITYTALREAFPCGN